MPGKGNRDLGLQQEEEGSLIFPWKHRYRGLFWLWGFLVLSFLLHATGFYMFQVVYPSSGRLEPYPARVMILDENNPANVLLLQELNDRLVFLQPASKGSEARRAMDDFTVAFRPSFAKEIPPFRAPTAPDAVLGISVEGRSSARQVTIPPFQAEAPGTPFRQPATGLKARDREDKPAIRRRWVLLGDLGDLSLPLTQADSFDHALPPIGNGPEIVLIITVDESGQIKSLSIESGGDHPAINDIVETVKTKLTFSPAPGSGQIEGKLKISK